MQKYKICPSCNTKNEPTRFECLNCETDLTGVKITDKGTEKMMENIDSVQSTLSKKLVRVCECGAKNPPNARKCRACQEDISDIIPIDDTDNNTENKLTFVLSSIDGQYAYKITSEETVVGRDSTMREYLASKAYVSRAHAKLMVVDNELLIENLSSTNYTYVNDQKIDKRTRLQDGDEIGLGGICIGGKRQDMAAYFITRIGQCM